MLLAQTNIALFRWPLNDARMEEFASQIDVMNRLAEASDGFIWRYTDNYDPTGRESPFDNPLLFFNLSVWRDVDSLRKFVFKTDHTELLRRKSEWTLPTGTPPLGMWWLDSNTNMPTVDDAVAKLTLLEQDPKRSDVFTFADVKIERPDQSN